MLTRPLPHDRGVLRRCGEAGRGFPEPPRLPPRAARGLLSFLSAEELGCLVLLVLSSGPFVASTAQSMRKGSKMPRADWKLMKQYPVPLPPQGLLGTFNGAVGPSSSSSRPLRSRITGSAPLATCCCRA